jgi:hypothetical protein
LDYYFISRLEVRKLRVQFGTLYIRIVQVDLGIRGDSELQILPYEGLGDIIRFLYFYLEWTSVFPILSDGSLESIRGILILFLTPLSVALFLAVVPLFVACFSCPLPSPLSAGLSSARAVPINKARTVDATITNATDLRTSPSRFG